MELIYLCCIEVQTFDGTAAFVVIVSGYVAAVADQQGPNMLANCKRGGHRAGTEQPGAMRRGARAVYSSSWSSTSTIHSDHDNRSTPGCSCKTDFEFLVLHVSAVVLCGLFEGIVDLRVSTLPIIKKTSYQ